MTGHDDARHAALLGALEELGFGIIQIADGRIVEADGRALELLGYTVDELRALPDAGPLFVPDRRLGFVELLERAARDEVVLPGHGELLRRNGTPVEVWLSGRRLVGDDGRPGLLLLVRDATEEARQRDELAAYAQVVQRMPLGMLLWRVDDPDDPRSLRVVAANPAAVAGSGRRPAELLGRTIGELSSGPFGLFRPQDVLDAHRRRELVDLGEVETTEGDGFFAPGTYRRAVVPLPGDMVASLVENVTARREADRHRRDLLQRILDAGSEERRRVAVGLHDDVIQTLAAALFDIESGFRSQDLAVVEASADRVEANLRAVIARLRGLVFDLLPPELEEGLAAGVDVAAEKTFAGTETKVAMDLALDVEPDPETRAMAYRIVAEALTNARRHAGASTVTVELRSDAEWLCGAVRDDGGGADELVTPPGHLGLRTMKERAELLGGTCSVRSAPGEGTVVEFRVPTIAAGADS